jgi:hypothetical protein
MKVSATVITTEFDRKLAALARSVGVETPQLVRGEARLLAAQAMVLTQPFGRGVKQKKFIEGSIERDFKKAIKPLKEDSFTNERMKGFIRKNKFKAAENFLKHVAKRDNAKVVPFSKEIHKDHRWTGKRSQQVFTLEEKKWKSRLAELKKRAGYIKAGWAVAYLHFGGTTVPAWIRRHLGYAAGSADSTRLIGSKPTAIFKASVAFADEFRILFEVAVDRRVAAMSRKLRQIMRGYSYAWKNGALATYKPKIPAEMEPQ